MAKRGRAAATKWKNKMAGASQEYKDGIAAVTIAPGEQAAAQQEAMQQRLNDSINSGRWAQATRGVSLADWKKAAETKGAARLTQGAAEGETKMAAFQEAMAAEYDRIKAEVSRMPNVTDSDREQRALYAIREMRKLKGKFKGQRR